MEDRKPGRSWWPREIPSEKEKKLALANLERKEWKVDYVFTHAAPVRAVEYLAANHLGFEGRKYLHDPVSEFLEQVAEKLAFSEWHFGHYHLESREFVPETGASGTFFANFRSVRLLCSDKEIPRDTNCDDTKEKKPFFLSGAW